RFGLILPFWSEVRSDGDGKLSRLSTSTVLNSREGEIPDLKVQQLTAQGGQAQRLSSYAAVRCVSIVDSPIDYIVKHQFNIICK
ncbi:hypothetical protein AVEN_239973-1, partial [Araneus ventricosus]